MATCINKLSGDLLFDCDDRPKVGLANQRAVLINYQDIDFGSSTSTGATITALTLKEGATGYKFEWYKELASGNIAFTPNTEDIDGFGHNFLGRLATTSAMNAESAKELAAGKFVVVFETQYQGLNQLDAFKVLGWGSGLRLSEMSMNTLENSSSLLFTLATAENQPEQYPYQIFLETDYTTTATTVDALFAGVIIP